MKYHNNGPYEQRLKELENEVKQQNGGEPLTPARGASPGPMQRGPRGGLLSGFGNLSGTGKIVALAAGGLVAWWIISSILHLLYVALVLAGLGLAATFVFKLFFSGKPKS